MHRIYLDHYGSIVTLSFALVIISLICLYLVVIRSLIGGILSPGLLRSGNRIQGIIVLDHYTISIRGINHSGITHTGVAELHLTGKLTL